MRRCPDVFGYPRPAPSHDSQVRTRCPSNSHPDTPRHPDTPITSDLSGSRAASWIPTTETCLFQVKSVLANEYRWIEMRTVPTWQPA
jgi:hypothetical protein